MENQELLKILKGVYVCFLFNDWFCAKEVLKIYIEKLEKVDSKDYQEMEF